MNLLAFLTYLNLAAVQILIMIFFLLYNLMLVEHVFKHLIAKETGEIDIFKNK